jgi:DNA polymerase III delta prime subunit
MSNPIHNSLAELHRPSNWSDYLGNDIYIKTLQYKIQKNLPVRGIWIDGPPGSGKTSLVNIWSKSLLCRNREADDYNPCNECDVCLGKDRLNIYEYNVTDATEAKDKINNLIVESYSNPYFNNSKSGIRRKVIIINEFQNASTAAQGLILPALEQAPLSTTWILVSMEESNKTVLEALKSRCLEINLTPNSNVDICNRLLTCYPDLNPESAEAIAQFSNNRMRVAWSILECLYPQYAIKDITPDLIYELKGGGATKDKRKELFIALKERNYSIITNLINQWRTSSNDRTICDLLIQDLIKQPSTTYTRALLSLLIHWSGCKHKYPLEAALCSVLPIDTFKESISIKEESIPRVEIELKSETIEEVDSKDYIKEDCIKDEDIKEESMNITDIATQLEKVSKEPLSPMSLYKKSINLNEEDIPFLLIKSISSLKLYYS